MKPSASRLPLEEVLDAYAVEKDTGRRTLERYLEEYPEYAGKLIDLSRELSRSIPETRQPLSVEETGYINTAWTQHVNAAPKPLADVFAAFSVVELRDIASKLGVPRQILSAFREGKVALKSVPRRFLKRMADCLNFNLEPLTRALAAQTGLRLARSYKADLKPETEGCVTFEQLLIDADVPEKDRAILMSEDE